MNTNEIRDVLNMAQAELRAMYKRCGIKGSNVLEAVDSAYEALASTPKEPETVHGNEAKKKVITKKEKLDDEEYRKRWWPDIGVTER